ncbi:MAG: MoaD/ThiS family protein [Nitrososphaerota archaeon]|nr:MoaD/ThiS family protein [Nitrososphaerota archaeon]
MKVSIELGGTFIYQFGREHSLNLKEGSSIEDALEMLGIKERIYIITVRNGNIAKFSDRLKDGDKLVVFPPIGGGN